MHTPMFAELARLTNAYKVTADYTIKVLLPSPGERRLYTFIEQYYSMPLNFNYLR